MKQLLIVNSSQALGAYTTNAATPYRLDSLNAGAIAFWELGASSLLTALPDKNFAIALGRGAGLAPIIIPEVDINTLSISKSLPTVGVAFSRTFTFPTPVAGTEYGITFIKKGLNLRERSNFSVSIVAKTTTAATEASALKTAIENSYGDKFTVTLSTAAITITAKTVGEQWEAKFIDGLIGTSFSTSVEAKKAVGDKEYILDLMDKCAADKGFRYLTPDGADTYKGYPESVENLVPNTSGSAGASTAGYAIYTLRFAVGRDSAKTTDEVVNQVVHIALPITNSSYSTIDGMLPVGKFIEKIVGTIDAAINDIYDEIETLKA